jgi:hypothetical protein
LFCVSGQLLVVGCWLWVVGCGLWVVGCWLLVVGCIQRCHPREPRRLCRRSSPIRVESPLIFLRAALVAFAANPHFHNFQPQRILRFSTPCQPMRLFFPSRTWSRTPSRIKPSFLGPYAGSAYRLRLSAAQESHDPLRILLYSLKPTPPPSNLYHL